MRVSDKSLHPSTNHGTGFLFMRAAVCKQAVACFSTLAREEMGWVGWVGEGEREREVMQMPNKNVFVRFFSDKVISFYGKNICHTYMYSDPFIIFFFI